MPLLRHGRARPGHPRLLLRPAQEKTWMPGTRPAMTVNRLTILPHAAVAEYVDDALPDRCLGSRERRREAERDHQRPHGAAMGDSNGVGNKGIEPLPHAQGDAGIAFAGGRRDAPFFPLWTCESRVGA